MTKTIGIKRNPGEQINFAKGVLRHYGFCAIHAGEGEHLTQVYNGPTGDKAITAISREMNLMVANIKVTPLDATGNAVGESIKL